MVRSKARSLSSWDAMDGGARRRVRGWAVSLLVVAAAVVLNEGVSKGSSDRSSVTNEGDILADVLGAQ